MSQIAYQDGRFARDVGRFDAATVIHSRDGRGVRFVFRLSGDAAPLARYVHCGHAQLLTAAQRQQLLRRLDFDGSDRHDFSCAILHPFGKPAQQPLVLERAFANLAAAAVRHVTGGLS